MQECQASPVVSSWVEGLRCAYLGLGALAICALSVVDVSADERAFPQTYRVLQTRSWVTLDSGITVRCVAESAGPHPSIYADVTVDYEGRLENGTIFDSTWRRAKPETFSLAHLIKGWQIVLQKMSLGDLCEFVIPPQFAYGEKGWRSNDSADQSIPANATLTFLVELLKFDESATRQSTVP